MQAKPKPPLLSPCSGKAAFIANLAVCALPENRYFWDFSLIYFDWRSALPLNQAAASATTDAIIPLLVRTAGFSHLAEKPHNNKKTTALAASVYIPALSAAFNGFTTANNTHDSIRI